MLNSAGYYLYPNFGVIQQIFSPKTSLLVGSKVVGVFGNTLAGDHMYSRHNWGKFPQHVKTPFSQKGKIFFGIFIAFLQYRQNFAHFQKNFSFIAWIIEKLLTPKNVVPWIPENSSFGTLFGSQIVDWCQRPLKSVWQHLYPNFPLIQDRLT